MSDTRLDAAIFGADPTPRIVAVEAGQREATLFLRDGGTGISTRSVPLIPWMITAARRPSPSKLRAWTIPAALAT